jgi:hypothetical protein
VREIGTASLSQRYAFHADRLRFAVARRMKPQAHFLHIGKTGGTAIQEALKPVRTRGRYAIALHRHRTTLADLPDGEPFFLCVRDPIARYVSAFYGRQRADLPRYYVPHRPGEAAAFARYPTANALAEAIGTPEGDAAMESIQHVRDHYWRWVVDQRHLHTAVEAEQVLGVLRQEHLDTDFSQLLERLELPQTTLQRDPVKAHRNPDDVDRSLSPLARHNLEEWYRDDYDFLRTCVQFHLVPPLT